MEGTPEGELSPEYSFSSIERLEEPRVRREFLKFINENNRLGAGNITMITEEIWERQRGSLLGVLLFRGEKLVGSVLTLVFRGSDGERITYTTYLCLHPGERGRKLASLLLSRLVQEGRERGITRGYFTTSRPQLSSLSVTSFPLRSWYRILNVGAARRANFTIPQTQGAAGSIQERLYFRISRPGTKIRKATVKDRELFLSFSQEQGRISIAPTEGEWPSFLRLLDLYFVFSSLGDLQGIFGLFPLPVLFKDQRTPLHTHILSLLLGSVLREALWICQETKIPVLYGNLLPPLTSDLLETEKALITNTTNYLGFYGTSIPPEKFSLPIL